MAFVTYILVVGYVLGMQDRFSPEVHFIWEIFCLFKYIMLFIYYHKVLATTSSSALTSLILEILAIWVTCHPLHISTVACVL